MTLRILTEKGYTENGTKKVVVVCGTDFLRKHPIINQCDHFRKKYTVYISEL